MLNSSTWPIDRALSGIITSGQSKTASNGNDGVFHVTQSIPGVSESKSFVS